MAPNFYALVQQYGENNVRHMGNHVIVIDRANDWAIGYTVDNYVGYMPDGVKNKVYTAIHNVEFDNWDAVYDFLYGKPTTAPDFTRAIL